MERRRDHRVDDRVATLTGCKTPMHALTDDVVVGQVGDHHPAYPDRPRRDLPLAKLDGPDHPVVVPGLREDELRLDRHRVGAQRHDPFHDQRLQRVGHHLDVERSHDRQDSRGGRSKTSRRLAFCGDPRQADVHDASVPARHQAQRGQSLPPKNSIRSGCNFLTRVNPLTIASSSLHLHGPRRTVPKRGGGPGRSSS